MRLKDSPTWLKVIVVSLLILGIFFRFSHLGKKIYWHDEAFTSLAISGHTLAELQQEISNHDQAFSITILEQYQHLNPERGVADTVNYLITSDPQHPPLYYVMARLWVQIFGDSPTEIRSLSALISLLIFPCVYWLCIELFNSPIVAWVALGLIAISPLEIFFAQEARQYGLWMVTILLSSATLLRAMRKETILSWGIYSLTLILGLYTHLFAILVAIAQGVYVLIKQSFLWNKTLQNYLLAGIFSFIMFIPWLIIFCNNIHTALRLTSWSSVTIITNPLTIIAILLTRTTRIFFDVNLGSDAAWIYNLASESLLSYSIVTIVICFLLIAYFIYFFVKNRLFLKRDLLIFLLGIIPCLFLFLSDLVLGGIRSIYFRYQLPFYLSLQIILVYILCCHVFSEHRCNQRISQLILCLFIIAGLVSDFALFNTNSWWLQINGRNTLKIAKIVKDYEHPLLLSDDHVSNLGAILNLSQILPSKVKILPIHHNHLVKIPPEYKTIFFFDFNNTLITQIDNDETYFKKLIVPTINFWQLKKK
ncbi:glycosyltransferase family 39 protein [Crocosphaera sp. XPORK-15E]|uniref:glycosyltransferase family 39 protein n=1 Tax=Crocosphaera sp. XPORK-15E TaxID=3110247 RepID=UPI002B1F7F0C|nr:glycosyltransferase family 39 protein [Crocosphaera sp. XPORK-15E]MEA5536957.1 glycosyltransferase family 39 protein [Crocosphaera sp. XPORK-15E]